MTELEFKALAAQGYNRIPLIAESFADLETPLSLYLKLANEPQHVLAGIGGRRRALRPLFVYRARRTHVDSLVSFVAMATTTEIVEGGVVTQTIDGDPLSAVQRYSDQFKVAVRPGLPRFAGGLAGYFGYDTVRVIEKKLARPKPDDVGVPDILLLLAEEVAVIDNLAGRIYLIVYADPRKSEAYAKARQRLRELKTRLYSPDRTAACARQRAPRGVSRACEE